MFKKIRDYIKNRDYKYSRVYDFYIFFRYKIPTFIGNIWKFRKELWNFRWWDYHFTLMMLYRSISIMEKGMHKGLEIMETRGKKIQKMQRLLELLDNKINDNYTELAEKELNCKLIIKDWKFRKIDKLNRNGEDLYELIDNETEEEKELNSNIYNRSREIEEAQWKEIWKILEGQDFNEYLGTQLNGSYSKDWTEWFDGSGLRGWWD